MCAHASVDDRQKVGKRRQTSQVWDIPVDQTVRVCLCAVECLCTCSYKCLWLFVWVNLFYWVHPCVVACVCLCVSQEETEEESECSVFVCVSRPAFVGFEGGVEPPRAKGDTAVAIYPNTPEEFSGWITRKDERRGEQRLQKLLGRYSWLPQHFCKKLCVHFILSRSASLRCSYLCVCWIIITSL